MPKSNVTINASFKKIQRSIITTSENGSVTTNQTNDSLVDVGETVELTLTPNQWCELESLTVTDSLGNNIPVNNNTFVMPAKNVIITTVFKYNKVNNDNNDNASNSTNSNIENNENNMSDEVSEKENKTTDKKAILNTPKTGDKIVLVIAILVVATTIFIILSRKNKDKKERKKH